MTGFGKGEAKHEEEWRDVISGYLAMDAVRILYGQHVSIDHVERERKGRYFYLKGVRQTDESVFTHFRRAFPGTDCGQKLVKVTDSITGLIIDRNMLYIFVPHTLEVYRPETLLEKTKPSEIILICCIIAVAIAIAVLLWNHLKDFESPFKSFLS